MKTSWIIGLAMAYVILAVISGIAEGTYFGGTGVETIWDAMNSFQTIDTTDLLTVARDVMVSTGQLFEGLWEILTWKFSFFVGVWAIFRWIFFAISLGVIVALVSILRGVSSG